MTLNEIISRLKTIALAHRQVRSFHHGLLSDFQASPSREYPVIITDNTSGTISISGHQSTMTFRIFFLDRVQVVSDAKENELDVISDMISVAMDYLAQLNHGNYHDWRVSGDNNVQIQTDATVDVLAGCYVDVDISFMYKQNVCAVPTNLLSYGSDPEVVIEAGQSIILRTTNTNERVKVTAYENTATDEIEFRLDKL